MRILERHVLIGILLRKLGKDCDIRTNKKITKIEETPREMIVTSDDGDQIHGQIIVGCDGTHSLIRHIMWEKANECCPGLIDVTEKRCKLSIISW